MTISGESEQESVIACVLCGIAERILVRRAKRVAGERLSGRERFEAARVCYGEESDFRMTGGHTHATTHR